MKVIFNILHSKYKRNDQTIVKLDEILLYLETLYHFKEKLNIICILHYFKQGNVARIAKAFRK